MTKEELFDHIAASAKEAAEIVGHFKAHPGPYLEAVGLLFGQAAFNRALGRDKEADDIEDKAEKLNSIIDHAKLLSWFNNESDRALKVAAQKAKIQEVLHASSKDGAISRETIDRIEAELKLL